METLTKQQPVKIGDVRYVNETGYRKTVRQLETSLPAIIDFSKTYDSLNLGKLTMDALMAIINGGVAGIIKRHEESEIKKTTITSVQDGIRSDAQKKKLYFIEKLKAVLLWYQIYLSSDNAEPWNWSDIAMRDGMPSVKKDEILERYTHRFNHPDQIRFYNAQLSAKRSWDEAVSIAKSYGYNAEAEGVVGDELLFDINPDGSLFLEPKAITYISL